MISNELPDDLIQLIELLLEGSLDEAGHRELEFQLRHNPQWVPHVRQHLMISGLLEGAASEDSDFVGKTSSHVVKLAMEEEYEFVGRVTRTIMRRRLTYAILAAAAVFLIGLIPLFLNSPQESAKPSHLVATLTRMNERGEVISTTHIRAGMHVEAVDGLQRLDFKNRAVVAVEAPMSMRVVSEDEVILEKGRLNAWCPDTAHGFQVRTSSAVVTDLGTSFGVNISHDGREEFVVLDGMVQVEKGEEKVKLSEGGALESSLENPLKSVVFEPSDFRKTWPLSYGILATRGAVVPADPDIPAKVMQMESNDNVLVIPEKRQVPFTRAILAEINGPGTLPGEFGGGLYVIGPNPEKKLRSFLIRYNPVGTVSEENFLRFEGEVTFDRPVLAICAQLEALEQTDGAFATGSWDERYRGIELQQTFNPPDSVTLSADRRTVKVIFYAGASSDEVRVILEGN
ncbi:hypothetical protein JIN85_05375 [Luteolibacter pohnpeiensis]|uniref:FecR protein domain-containing protein n=1 Tax=Luteolibacter pohnpeiensis TaxID=454153 RepID=A0A934S621_9BACT|nr:hypothetical protein [Luteolibacter pohnpeiensis]MBK1881834.1 hypothetical protein [Luteolibacter pohnpeiensis]